MNWLRDLAMACIGVIALAAVGGGIAGAVVFIASKSRP